MGLGPLSVFGSFLFMSCLLLEAFMYCVLRSKRDSRGTSRFIGAKGDTLNDNKGKYINFGYISLICLYIKAGRSGKHERQ